MIPHMDRSDIIVADPEGIIVAVQRVSDYHMAQTAVWNIRRYCELRFLACTRNPLQTRRSVATWR